MNIPGYMQMIDMNGMRWMRDSYGINHLHQSKADNDYDYENDYGGDDTTTQMTTIIIVLSKENRAGIDDNHDDMVDKDDVIQCSNGNLTM